MAEGLIRPISKDLMRIIKTSGMFAHKFTLPTTQWYLVSQLDKVLPSRKNYAIKANILNRMILIYCRIINTFSLTLDAIAFCPCLWLIYVIMLSHTVVQAKSKHEFRS